MEIEAIAQIISNHGFSAILLAAEIKYLLCL